MGKRANELCGRDWAKYSISVWNDIHKTGVEKKLKHPAMFPEQLAARLITCFTTKDELNILDPFMGSGTTLIAAANLNRTGVGFELNPDYINLAKQRLSETNSETSFQIFNTNALEIPRLLKRESIDLCVTSPPYWDILLQKRTADHKEARNYGDDNEDLGLIRDYGQFIDTLGAIFAGVFQTLKNGKYCLVNVMDLRKRDKFFPLHIDLAVKMREIGYQFDDLIIWDRRQEYNHLRTLGYPAVFRLNKIHEYILIFKKLI